eukprot:6175273-Pleurochrysis_carterae.AAC.3
MEGSESGAHEGSLLSARATEWCDDALRLHADGDASERQQRRAEQLVVKHVLTLAPRRHEPQLKLRSLRLHEAQEGLVRQRRAQRERLVVRESRTGAHGCARRLARDRL